jgi:SAM-dependent methyltransferase
VIESPGFEEANRRTYARKNVVSSYVQEGLLPGEERLFAKLNDALAGKRVLDIGVGGGRTTAALLRVADSYAAVDYSPGCVEVVKQRYGLEAVHCADAREMPMFDDGAFDFILFSFNGIDYVDDEGRELILKEVRRLLAPGGVFLFSSHNLDYRHAGLLPWQSGWSSSPAFAKACLRAMVFTHRRRRSRAREIRTHDYALLNDEAHNYSLLTYYARRDAQLRQLESAGFTDVTSCGEQGEATTTKDDESRWLYYIAHG